MVKTLSQKTSTDSVYPFITTGSIISLSTVQEEIERYLETFFERQKRASEKLNAAYVPLWNALQSSCLAGGKRLRPYLTLLIYQAYGGEHYQKILPVSVAQELLHASLLVHDDIIDNDYIRHGRLNVAGEFEEIYQHIDQRAPVKHYAMSAALLGGDLLLSAAYQVISEANIADGQKVRCYQELSQAMFVVGGGEFLDMEAVMRPFNEVSSLEIANLKTAYYSFVSPLRTGAQLASASAVDIEIIVRLGRYLGIAYQLADDIIGLYGQELITGKSVLSDIRGAKRTYLMAHALQTASAAQLKILSQALGNSKLSYEQAAQVQAIVTDCGAKADTEALINRYVGQALECLQQLSIGTEYKTALHLVVRQATERAS